MHMHRCRPCSLLFLLEPFPWTRPGFGVPGFVLEPGGLKLLG